MRCHICGRFWEIQYPQRLPPDRDGDCDAPKRKDRLIRIRRSLKGKRRLETVIHECLHAADWSKTEEWVAQTATDIAEILDEMGYHADDD
jgi:hypothetical protein